MCGISGIISDESVDNKKVLRSEVIKMTDALKHRGNNEPKFFEDSRCFFGHQRLSIIDLSPAAAQPMSSLCGRYVIVFNGEIYNYIELASELRQHGADVSGNNDTEVLLYSYIVWGKDCLNKLRGMFSFAIWDLKKQKLFAARDHLGIKPFYWFNGNIEGKQCFAFASEIKSFLKTSFISRIVNKQALKNYLLFYSINPPNTIIKDIYSLMPGHYLEYENGNIKISSYWSVFNLKTDQRWQGVEEIQARVRETLYESVKLRMRADVSVGAFLSGGLDSATIVGLMSSLSDKPVETFSVGFGKEGDYINELNYAKLAAQKFASNHHELIIEGNDFKSNFKKFISHIDQPSGDGINSFLVSQAAANKVTVALSGLGGDELFLGYRYFQDLARMYRIKSKKVLNKLVFVLAEIYKRSDNFKAFAWKNKLDFLKHWPADGCNFYFKNRILFSNNDLEKLTNMSLPEFDFVSNYKHVFENEEDILNAFSKLELAWYTTGTLLRDADVTSMAHTLEVRVPFLDKNLIELMLNVPSSYKVNAGQKSNKPLLTGAFDDLLPKELLSLPKKGFEMPIGFWLKDNFSTKLNDLINVSWFNKEYMIKLTNKFYKDPRNYLKIWALLVLKEWLEENRIEISDEKDSLYTSWTGPRGSAAEPSLFDRGA